MRNRKVLTAVVLGAGRGTRLAPVSAAIPKIMMPFGRLPMLEHVLVELRQCGLEKIVVVISAADAVTEPYFAARGVFDLPVIRFVAQEQATGPVDALLAARPEIEFPVLVAMGDTVFRGADTAAPTARLLEEFGRAEAEAAVLVEREPADTGRHLAKCLKDSGRTGPLVARTTGAEPVGLASRWVLSSKAMAALASTEQPAGGERQLRLLLHQDALGPILGVPLVPPERRTDVGTWPLYLVNAALEATFDPEAGPTVRAVVAGDLAANQL